MKIVLIEDDVMLLKSLSFFLTNQGHSVEAFDNGMDAIAYLQEQASGTDLIITDLNLPFAGGQQVIHEARHSSNPNMGIIVLTSSGSDATELEVFDLGADDFVAKPFSPTVLLKRIEKTMSIKK